MGLERGMSAEVVSKWKRVGGTPQAASALIERSDKRERSSLCQRGQLCLPPSFSLFSRILLHRLSINVHDDPRACGSDHGDHNGECKCRPVGAVAHARPARAPHLRSEFLIPPSLPSFRSGHGIPASPGHHTGIVNSMFLGGQLTSAWRFGTARNAHERS